MLLPTAVILLLVCELCASIRVPASWDERDSEVIPNPTATQDFGAETFQPQALPQEVPVTAQKPVPVEYFEYTAKKPQFAVDVASFHGVQSPEKHYSAYPIIPHTGQVKPEFGKHKIVTSENAFHKPLQEFANINEHDENAAPVSSSYEVFHPYEAEIPAFQELYKDPILNKIRGDLENSKNRLQKYENEAGEPDISKEEYLENPHKTGNRLVPHRNVPAPYEIHRPQRRPVYYRYQPRPNHRDNYLNHRLRHPWNQYVKVRPAHYQPIKNHIHHLRQNHALKYDDERNEYPQVHVLENYSDPKDGYDIYEKGKDKYVQLRNNVDESINKAVMENRPAKYQKLEVLSNDSSDSEEEDEDEFVPIKNYAQVRKTETYRHLPRSAALREADTLDEIRNAPRLREAVKSTKAQTVYSEEGYEDAAYDHAGEQKHASENEGHGGFLKQHELSGGKYKIPTESGAFNDGHGSVYGDKLVDSKKWSEDNKDSEKETDEDDYTEDEHEHLLEATNHQEQEEPDENTTRNKRENSQENVTDSPRNTTDGTPLQSESTKRQVKFEVPQIDLNSTFLKEKEILQIAKLKAVPKKDDLKDKYPYYFRNLRRISKDSPLRYSENLKLIPRKTDGGTEFYNSRSVFECPEIEDVPDPVPEKLKTGENPEDDENEESSSKGEENFDTTKKQPRLKGLGDKIDCFKAKYFGENPLDSPFFKEEIISNPEPIKLPNLATYKLGRLSLKGDKGDSKTEESNSQNTFYSPLKQENITDLYNLIEKLRNDKNDSQESFLKNTEFFNSALKTPKYNNTENVFTDIIQKIKNHTTVPKLILLTPIKNITTLLTNENGLSNSNETNSFFHNKEDITKRTPVLRKKRGAPFTYEPYKIIREGQVQDSKKTTTAGNINPLIKQLQSSKVVDKVNKASELELTNVPTKFVNTRTYKDIGKSDRKQGSKNDKPNEPDFIDVSADSRRGEPRYEIRHPNHKSEYSPVENKKAISIEDYKTQTNKDLDDESSSQPSEGEKSVPQRSSKTSRKPYFDVSKYLPAIPDLQKVEASNTVRKTVKSNLSSTPSPKTAINRSSEEENEDEDYDEYDDEEDDFTTTTTTTPKPIFRRRMRTTTTTTEEPPQTTEQPRLRLVTRFRDYKPDSYKTETDEPRKKSTVKKTETANEEIEPQYREKKKKLTKSTLVTDTKKYGDDDDEDDDMRQKEVDAMMGIKQDIGEYMPLYEKEELNNKRKEEQNKKHHAEDDDEDENDDEIEDDDDDEDEDDDIDNDDEENDESPEEDDEEYESSETENTKDGQGEETNDPQPVVTTSQPERTLAITTDSPKPTSPARLERIQEKPVVTRKKIEIHKELPVNNSSPHVTQYKQDIKEEEVIKEIPRRKRPNKHVETLELYKDENLPKEINKLSDVEVFKENLNLKAGPKHGGNYRRMPTTTETPVRETNPKADTEASQTEYKKEVRQDGPQKIRISLRSRDYKPEQKSAKLELAEPSKVAMHGGNLRYKGRSRNNNESEKLIELQEEEDDDDDFSTESEENKRYSSRRGRPMHGGNYRSANLKAEKEPEPTEPSKKSRAKEARTKSADLLNSFAQAVPILTTTPKYILDPSKRMYYYVDT